MSRAISTLYQLQLIGNATQIYLMSATEFLQA